MRDKSLVIIVVIAAGAALALFQFQAASAMMAPLGASFSTGPWAWGWGMMGGHAGCPYYAWGQVGGGQRLTMDQARQLLEDYVASIGGGLELREVMEFQNNFYAVVAEADTGIGAFELLLNPYTGRITPEPGPNMMWNTKYGMMSYGPASPAAEMPLTPEEAEEVALRYLGYVFAGQRVGVEEPTRFYGYYTIDFELNGEVYGMLSVNGYTGQVWPHSWHGRFIQEVEIE